MKRIAIMIFMISSFGIIGCDLYTPTTRDDLRVEDRFVQLDYIKVTVTVLSNLNSLPIDDAKVTVTYNDDTGNVVWDHDNPVSSWSRTGQNGVAVVTVSVPSRSHQINTPPSQHIISDKTVQITVEQSDFHTVSTTRTYETKYVRTIETFNDRRYLMYAAEGTATVYMSPK